MSELSANNELSVIDSNEPSTSSKKQDKEKADAVESVESVKSVESAFSKLLKWNKVLSIERPIDVANVYLERAMFYQDRKLFKECLDNLTWAEEHNVQEDLTERKEFCKLEALRQQKQVGSKEDQKLFQLSYEPNPCMPFVIDCLKLQNNIVYGNHVITDKVLNIGDVICIEKPFLGVTTNSDDDDTIFEKDSVHQRCHHCYQFSNMSLTPCDNCPSALFCSQRCKDDAMKIYHKYECFINNAISNVKSVVRSMRTFFVTLYLYDGDIGAIKKRFKRRGSRVLTVFDCDMSDPKKSYYYPNLMDIFDSYRASEKNIFFQMVETLFNCHPGLAIIWRGNKEFILQFLARHADNLRELGQVMVKWPGNSTQLIKQLPERSNTFPINSIRKIVGVTYYPFFGLINHSCVPNIIRHINEQNQMVLIVCRPIQPGEQLFVDYNRIGDPYFCKLPKAERLKILMEDCSFVCTCPVCLEPTSKLCPLSKDEIINKRELIRLIEVAAEEVKTWNREEARQKYLHFMTMLQNFHTLLPPQELCILQDWIHTTLVIIERTDSSF